MDFGNEKMNVEVEKNCGNCRYGNYYKRRLKRTLVGFVDCEVYSCKKEISKVCVNWKEKKNEAADG